MPQKSNELDKIELLACLDAWLPYFEEKLGKESASFKAFSQIKEIIIEYFRGKQNEPR